ncbi:MAG: membrane protein insertase YidC, partial [Thioalkalivibrio sp.]|nr:membrane protein insertase YidC [Thioalkalivibrio sp.]
MRTEIRFLLAVLLMLTVLIGTNFLFPPITEEIAEPEPTGEVTGPVVPAPGADGTAAGPEVGVPQPTPAVGPGGVAGEPAVAADAAEAAPEVAPERVVTVEGPLFRYAFSSHGARVLSAELLRFDALNKEGVVNLIPEGVDGYFGHRVVVGTDTLDLSRLPFTVTPEEGLTIEEGGASGTLRFTYEAPGNGLNFEVGYTFHADRYQVDVEGRLSGVQRPLLLTDVGEGLAYAEADSADEARMMAYVYNHLQDGIESTNLDRGEPGIIEGPLLWTAVRSKFFVLAMLAGRDEASSAANGDYLGGLLLQE